VELVDKRGYIIMIILDKASGYRKPGTIVDTRGYIIMIILD